MEWCVRAREGGGRDEGGVAVTCVPLLELPCRRSMDLGINLYNVNKVMIEMMMEKIAMMRDAMELGSTLIWVVLAKFELL